MANIVRIDPPLPMTTSKGKGWAHFLIDYGIESHLYWVIFIDETGEIWTLPNPEVRADKNYTMERYLDEKTKEKVKSWHQPMKSKEEGKTRQRRQSWKYPNYLNMLLKTSSWIRFFPGTKPN